MEIKITYVFKRDDGIIGYSCGIKPDYEIIEERQILVPEKDHQLKRISDEQILSSIWLQGDDVKENYEEVQKESIKMSLSKH